MTNEQKQEIAAAANRYMQEKGMTAAAFATYAKVNASYLSAIMNGVFMVPGANGGTVEIADKYFVLIAEAIGHTVKKVYWPHVMTQEFVEMISLVKKAKDNQLNATIIISTGAGKTYAANKFKQVNPLHTYVIKMHSLLKINDLFGELIEALKIPAKGSIGYRRAQILIKLREIKRNGGSPQVILDEAENMNSNMRAMLKGFMDGVEGYCSLVLIGTHKLLEILEDAKAKDKEAGPQFYRRVKAGIREIKPVMDLGKRFQPFFNALNITDKKFQKLLCEKCENYGELNTYIEPALREADVLGVPFDEDFFRVRYNFPKAV